MPAALSDSHPTLHVVHVCDCLKMLLSCFRKRMSAEGGEPAGEVVPLRLPARGVRPGRVLHRGRHRAVRLEGRPPQGGERGQRRRRRVPQPAAQGPDSIEKS